MEFSRKDAMLRHKRNRHGTTHPYPPPPPLTEGHTPPPPPPQSNEEEPYYILDTLDKKMQTILEREDLSADKRLKLYDQSLYRYLNVYDDYRPRPVAVAPEPVKQDLVDDEILESDGKKHRTELKNKFDMNFNEINHKINMKMKKNCQVIISPLLQSMLGFRQAIFPAGKYVSDWVADVKKELNYLYVYCPW